MVAFLADHCSVVAAPFSIVLGVTLNSICG
jgi:hypothetical protein